jgi:hypothetical protein
MISSFSLLLIFLVWFNSYQHCNDYSRDFAFPVDGRAIKAYIPIKIQGWALATEEN